MGWSSGKRPFETLAASIALAYMARLCIIILGDLNARTAALLANQLLDPARTSMDKAKVTARGTWLCEVFKDYNTVRVFVSGAEIFGPSASGGKFTCFQGIRSAYCEPRH
jgi:hypothetical protein